MVTAAAAANTVTCTFDLWLTDLLSQCYARSNHIHKEEPLGFAMAADVLPAAQQIVLNHW